MPSMTTVLPVLSREYGKIFLLYPLYSMFVYIYIHVYIHIFPASLLSPSKFSKLLSETASSSGMDLNAQEKNDV